MGNADLRELAVIEATSFDAIAGSVIGVDAHNWLYRYLTTTVRWTDTSAYTTAGGEEVPNLIGLVRGLPKFFDHELQPVFIFDGAVTELKAEEIADRRAAKEQAAVAAEAARAAGNEIEAARHDARTQRLTETIQRTTRELLTLLDIPYLEAPAEGEAQAAHLAKQGDVDYVGTEDYDALLVGAPLTLRKLTTSDDPELMDFEATLAKHDLSHEQLVEVALLCGTDFNEGLRGFGPVTALEAIQTHGDLESVLAAEERELPGWEAVKALFLSPSVTDDYRVEPTATPDFDGAWEYLTEEWEIPSDALDSGFERLRGSFSQTGLDRWT